MLFRSSVRFERGVDLNQTVEAIDYAAYLLQKYAGGKVLKGVVHQGIEKEEDKVIELTDKDITKYLGITIPQEELIKLLSNLGFKVEVDKKKYQVLVPNRRMDITIKADIIEELARLHGYEFLQETLPKDGPSHSSNKSTVVAQSHLSTLQPRTQLQTSVL